MPIVIKPSILFINRVLPPDRGATGRCLADLAGRFATAGWQVTVLICGNEEAPNPALPGVRVVQASGGRTAGETPRMSGYLAALSGLLTTALRLGRHDVVVTMTDPPLLATLGPVLRLRWKAALINWSHDLYPDLLPVLGVRLPAPMQRLLLGISRAALRRHDAVVAIGDCMAARLTASGIDRSRITVIPNWADPLIRPVDRSRNRFRADLGLGNRFTVAYSGNFGLAHPLDALLDTAAAMGRDAPDIAFLMIGEGRGYGRIESEVVRRKLTNVRLLPWQAPEQLAESLGAADLHVAAMAEEATGLLVPSKIAGVLAAGRPCILLGSPNGTGGRLLRDHDCGVVVPPGDGAALAASVRRFADDSPFWRASCDRASIAAARWHADAAAERFISLAARLCRTASIPIPAGASQAKDMAVVTIAGNGNYRA
jgi:colanic acid biosynthesis glycosyl transferase WcaI